MADGSGINDFGDLIFDRIDTNEPVKETLL
jgi:hypothetical protein